MNKIIIFLIALAIFTTGMNVSQVQAQNSVVPNTTISVQTQGYIFTSTMRYGTRGGEVFKLQQYLVSNSYLQGVVDGVFGRMTHSAVVRFQIANGLKGDGIIGMNTRAILNNTIVVPPTQNTPTVLSPNGRENWLINSTHVIAWNVNNPSTLVDIYLETQYATVVPNCFVATCGATFGMPTYVLDRNVSSMIPYNWIVATDINNQSIPTGSYYGVKICIAGTNVCDYSNEAFTLSNGTFSQPSITVLSPNGGEILNVNSSHQIKWNTVNLPNNAWVLLELKKAGQVVHVFDQKISATSGVYTGLIPQYVSGYGDVSGMIVSGSDYTLGAKVYTGANPVCIGYVSAQSPCMINPPTIVTTDESDRTFTISTSLKSGIKGTVLSGGCGGAMPSDPPPGYNSCNYSSADTYKFKVMNDISGMLIEVTTDRYGSFQTELSPGGYKVISIDGRSVSPSTIGVQSGVFTDTKLTFSYFYP